MATSITIIYSPYHVGARDHRVGNGPYHIRSHGVIKELENMNVKIHTTEIERVDEFEGEIGRSFEVLRRTSKAVTTAVSNNSFPLVLSGNCMATVAVAAGLQTTLVDRDLGFVYFDAHDDLDTPDTHENGYLDAMSLSMLNGDSWKLLMSTVPGFQPLPCDRFVYCGLRVITDVNRNRMAEAGMEAVWGSVEKKVDFAKELESKLRARSYGPAVVHLDLDVLDESYGKVNDYPSPGGMFEDQLVDCMNLVPKNTTPKALTVCSFDPDCGDGDRIAKIGVRAIKTFVQSLIDMNHLKTATTL